MWTEIKESLRFLFAHTHCCTHFGVAAHNSLRQTRLRSCYYQRALVVAWLAPRASWVAYLGWHRTWAWVYPGTSRRPARLEASDGLKLLGRTSPVEQIIPDNVHDRKSKKFNNFFVEKWTGKKKNIWTYMATCHTRPFFFQFGKVKLKRCV